MFSPETPTKVDEGFVAIARLLSAKWGLDIPLLVKEHTPSRRSRPGPVGDQVYDRIRFLFYRNKDGLQHAIDQFEKHAVVAFSQWKFKPHADLDVLPNRSTPDSALRSDSFLKRTTITEEAAAELLKSLLRFLTDVTDGGRAEVGHKSPDKIRGRSSLSSQGL